MPESRRLFVAEPYRAPLLALEAGEAGVIRLPITPPPVEPLSHWYQHPEEGWWTCGNNVGQTWRCPLQPGAVWVPEPFLLQVTGPCSYRVVFRDGGKLEDVLPPNARPLGVWLPLATMPADCARLRLDVLEPGRPARWCPKCEGDGMVEWSEDVAGAPMDVTGPCDACRDNSSPWHWRAPVRRVAP